MAFLKAFSALSPSVRDIDGKGNSEGAFAGSSKNVLLMFLTCPAPSPYSAHDRNCDIENFKFGKELGPLFLAESHGFAAVIALFFRCFRRCYFAVSLRKNDAFTGCYAL